MLKDKPEHSSNSSSQSSNSSWERIWDFWGPIFITFSLYLGIRNFIAEARYIPSESMLPALQVNDKLIVEKLILQWRSPRRGEIVVFNSPYAFDKGLLATRGEKPLPSAMKCGLLSMPIINLLPSSDKACDAWIKRVVAVGGDWVFVNPRGEVYIDDKFIEEPYAILCDNVSSSIRNCGSLKVYVPKGHVFVLGDNRPNSTDGRFWEGKFLPEKEILGRAVWRFWPINRIGNLNQ